MARHGTMPELPYQRKLQISDRIDFASSEAAVDSDAESVHSEGSEGTEGGEELVEFDTSSDEDEEEGQESGETYVPQIDRMATFLVGRTTRFGRNVRINSRILF